MTFFLDDHWHSVHLCTASPSSLLFVTSESICLSSPTVLTILPVRPGTIRMSGILGGGDVAADNSAQVKLHQADSDIRIL